jgi:uncharacterized protein
MPLSLHDATIPVFIRSLRNLAAFLEKGRAFADEKGMAHAELLEARLIEDMHSLVAQVQRASDSAKFTAVRVGKAENVVMEDKEASFDDLQARIAATVALLEKVPSDAMDGQKEAEIVLATPTRSVTFIGKNYVFDFALPNFFFHVTTAYALLRSKGVPIGKMDYLGGL